MMSLPTFLTALLLASRSLAAPTTNVTVVEVVKTICNDGKLAAENPRAAFFRQLVQGSDYCNYTKVPTPRGAPMKVGIVGAGAAGLYAAILLDSLGIEYDIHEASDRVGGRIFTYHFDQAAWDKSSPSDPAYYDYYVSLQMLKLYTRVLTNLCRTLELCASLPWPTWIASLVTSRGV